MSKLVLEDVAVHFDIQSTEGRRNSVFSRYFISNKTEQLTALNDINLILKDGDRIALIGSNGAGKSTLLRVMSGILPPSRGELLVEGSVLPLIRGSIALVQQASVSQNVKMEGLKLGLSGAKLDAYIRDVLEIIDLEKFVHAPLVSLSAGMKKKVLLGLSCMRPETPDILLMDEWIGVLDKRILADDSSLTQLIENSKIFVFASHNKRLLRTLCEQAYFMENGEIKDRLPIDRAIERYL